jgi:outer membrane protease
MINIKGIGVLVILAALAPAHAGADEGGKYGFSLSPALGFLYGQGEEILYKYPGRDQFVSQLLWDLKPLLYAGLGADFGPRDPFANRGFAASASLKLGLPLRTGAMEDRDWLNEEYDHLTNYSEHDAYSRFAFLADLSAGYSWRLTDFLAMRAGGEFSFMRYSWLAKDGYYQYTYPPYLRPWNQSITKNEIQGKVIKYTQNWFIVSPFLSFKLKLHRLFALEGKFAYSPLIYVYARDEHLLTDTEFLDMLFGGSFFDWGGRVFFTASNNMEFSASVSYRRISGPRGNSYYTDHGKFYQNLYNGGAGFSALDSSLGVRFFIK